MRLLAGVDSSTKALAKLLQEDDDLATASNHSARLHIVTTLEERMSFVMTDDSRESKDLLARRNTLCQTLVNVNHEAVHEKVMKGVFVAPAESLSNESVKAINSSRWVPPTEMR